MASGFVREMDFACLFDTRRKLLRVGYDVGADRPDAGYYDLLASEARSAVFLAIAKGDLPREAWFRLGRKLTAWRGHRVLLSWSGTMFEYLMPSLFMETYASTVLAAASGRWWRYSESTAASATCRGAFPNRHTAPATAPCATSITPFGVPAIALKRRVA